MSFATRRFKDIFKQKLGHFFLKRGIFNLNCLFEKIKQSTIKTINHTHIPWKYLLVFF